MRATMAVMAAAMVAATASACGTTSAIQTVGVTQAPVEPGAAAASQYAAYQTVAVLDFNDETNAEEAREAGAMARFADLIAAEIRESGTFAEVVRGEPEGEALIISGDIVRYEEGSPALRFLIGAGGAFFDANVRLSDHATGAQLGVVTVDKNSWGPGGIIASVQSADGFMEGAAQSIADDLDELRAGG